MMDHVAAGAGTAVGPWSGVGTGASTGSTTAGASVTSTGTSTSCRRGTAGMSSPGGGTCNAPAAVAAPASARSLSCMIAMNAMCFSSSSRCMRFFSCNASRRDGEYWFACSRRALETAQHLDCASHPLPRAYVRAGVIAKPRCEESNMCMVVL